MRMRHWGVAGAFVAMVVLPFVVVVFYLFAIAVDQYSSTTGFTVRQEEGTAASQLMGGLAQITGGTVGTDGNILFEFIQSQQMVRDVNDELDLVSHYTSKYDEDPYFAMAPDDNIEALVDYWNSMVLTTFDEGTGLIEIRVLAFEPQMAQDIARAIVARSQEMINNLNQQAREDAMSYARADLDEAVERLKEARQRLTDFRTRTQIVDPQADISGRMGVLNNLQQQLAEALIEFDLLGGANTDGDPRSANAQRRIDVIQNRIAEERISLSSDGAGIPGSSDYPALIAEYEGLVVDREFAEETYRAALAALDSARAEASRKSRYLATYIEPTLAEESQYPRRFVQSAITGGFLFLLWAIASLVYYSIRDRG
ncbi:sugar transporter [Palleronia sediminis]|uniref:Sugar transporter n=2 Tax=Palleronia sediminis TaxID=2547833 RepID=A0A4R6A572_9RHOB|nr:sugar transporter [Palleronia sediminis]